MGESGRARKQWKPEPRASKSLGESREAEARRNSEKVAAVGAKAASFSVSGIPRVASAPMVIKDAQL